MGANLSFPVADLSDRVAIVTGGNTGIGYETAKALAVMGAQTIIACRSSERANSAVERMKDELQVEFPDKSVKISWMLLDLGSFRSTKDFTTEFKEKNLPLHILVNNAGIALAPLTMTEDGYEAHFQVNHLSPMLLTLELLPIMVDTASHCGDTRIVFVSSEGHKTGSFVPGNMNAEHSYGRLKFYCNSKLYNVMTASALQRRLEGLGITVSSLHPGVVDTDLSTKHTSDSKTVSLLLKTLHFIFKAAYRDWKKGAATSINCAVNPELNSRQALYYDSCQAVQSAPHSRNKVQQEQLWEISINIIKEYLTAELVERYGPTPSESNTEVGREMVTIVTGTTEESGTRVSYRPTEDPGPDQTEPQPSTVVNTE